MPELKPCPFCGYHDEDVVIFDKENHQYPYRLECPSVKCITNTYYRKKKDAINDWNTRHSPWISVEDRLPENEEYVFVYQNYDDFGLTGRIRVTNYKFNKWDGPGFARITHWMLLPVLPASWSQDVLSVSNGGPGGESE
jgi:Protein of unknown function (DUF551)/Restriction alleviation protein Lar